MTSEEAIKIIQTAMAEVEWEHPMDYAAAFEMAIAALRAQPEAEENDPLTPEELREMAGEPVYMASEKYSLDNGWTVCLGSGYQETDGIKCIKTGHGYFCEAAIERGDVKFYRRKPEQAPGRDARGEAAATEIEN